MPKIQYLTWIQQWFPVIFPVHAFYHNQNAVPSFQECLLNHRLRYVVHGRGCNPHRSLWRHWWRHNSETVRDREKRRPLRPMKSSELSKGENRIDLRQLLQNRKWRHLWRHNLGSRRKLQKKWLERILVLCVLQYNQKSRQSDQNCIGRDSFWAPKPLKYNFLGVTQPPGVAQPL